MSVSKVEQAIDTLSLSDLKAICRRSFCDSLTIVDDLYSTLNDEQRGKLYTCLTLLSYLTENCI